MVSVSTSSIIALVAFRLEKLVQVLPLLVIWTSDLAFFRVPIRVSSLSTVLDTCLVFVDSVSGYQFILNLQSESALLFKRNQEKSITEYILPILNLVNPLFKYQI